MRPSQWFTAAAVAAAAAAPPPPPRGDQAARVRNDADVSSVADAANAGAIQPGGAVATGAARSRVRPRQDAANAQRLAGCPPATCRQRAWLGNEAWLASRAGSGNSGTAWPQGAITTGDALSELSLRQAALNHQLAATCAGCRQRASLSNRLSAGSEADAANASDAPASARIARPPVASRLYLDQQAESHEVARGRCGCRQFAAVANAATVWSRVAGPRLAGAERLETDASESNRASIAQAGRTNVVALQQSGQQVEQAGRYNLFRIHTRQTLVLDGAVLVERARTTRVITRSRASLPPGLGRPPARRPGDVWLRRQDGPQGNAVRLEQRARTNLAAVQQATQRVHQVGVYNVAVLVVEQRIVLRPARPGAPVVPASALWCSNARRSLAAVQQSSQSVHQSGRFNSARAVVVRRIEAPAAERRCVR
jgi:hypothetical protein